MVIMNKENIKQTVMGKLEEKLCLMSSFYETSRNDVLEAEGRMKTRYDSMRTESAFLADAQVKRINSMKDELTALRRLEVISPRERVFLGSLVEICDYEIDEKRLYFVLPAGGGLKIDYEGKEILVVTSQAPICKAFLGKEVGDDFQFRNRTYTIEDIK